WSGRRRCRDRRAKTVDRRFADRLVGAHLDIPAKELGPGLQGSHGAETSILGGLGASRLGQAFLGASFLYKQETPSRIKAPYKGGAAADARGHAQSTRYEPPATGPRTGELHAAR